VRGPAGGKKGTDDKRWRFTEIEGQEEGPGGKKKQKVSKPEKVRVVKWKIGPGGQADTGRQSFYERNRRQGGVLKKTPHRKRGGQTKKEGKIDTETVRPFDFRRGRKNKKPHTTSLEGETNETARGGETS